MHPTVIHIRRILKDRGMSYAALSELSGVDESKLKRVLSGKQSMTLEMRDTLMLALSSDYKRHEVNISPSELISLWVKLPITIKQSMIHLMCSLIDETNRK